MSTQQQMYSRYRKIRHSLSKELKVHFKVLTASKGTTTDKVTTTPTNQPTHPTSLNPLETLEHVNNHTYANSLLCSQLKKIKNLLGLYSCLDLTHNRQLSVSSTKIHSQETAIFCMCLLVFCDHFDIELILRIGQPSM